LRRWGVGNGGDAYGGDDEVELVVRWWYRRGVAAMMVAAIGGGGLGGAWRGMIFLDYRVTLGFGSTGGLDLACPTNRLPCHGRIQWVLGRITNSLPGVGTDRSPHKSLDT
ncbi:hypothetical protein Tco_1411442, partial [Tanacetum coccineum]